MKSNIISLSNEISETLRKEIPIKIKPDGLFPEIGQRGIWNYLIKNDIEMYLNTLLNNLDDTDGEVTNEISIKLSELNDRLKECFNSFSDESNVNERMNNVINKIQDLKSVIFTINTL